MSPLIFFFPPAPLAATARAKNASVRSALAMSSLTLGGMDLADPSALNVILHRVTNDPRGSGTKLVVSRFAFERHVSKITHFSEFDDVFNLVEIQPDAFSSRGGVQTSSGSARGSARASCQAQPCANIVTPMPAVRGSQPGRRAAGAAKAARPSRSKIILRTTSPKKSDAAARAPPIWSKAFNPPRTCFPARGQSRPLSSFTHSSFLVCIRSDIVFLFLVYFIFLKAPLRYVTPL